MAHLMAPASNRPPTVRLSRPRWQRWVAIAAGALIVSALGFVGVQAYRLSRGILVANASGSSAAFALNFKRSGPDSNQFQHPGDGRVNIVVLGIGGVSDKGVAHAGTYLTDSIQLLSLDTLNHRVSLTSLPRDLEVKTPDGYGYEKINAVYSGLDGTTEGGGEQIKAAVGTVLGTRVSNYIVIDFTAAKSLVDAVGGVDITVSTAIDDPAYPAADDINFDPFFIAAGPQHLNGATALKYMRTRHDDSDFGRSGRQQAVFSAVQQKALSLGVLANPSKVNQIVTTLGRHVKTDLTIDEIGKLVTALKQIAPAGITSHVLDTSDELGLLTSSSDPDIGYVAQPIEGLTKYTAIHTWYQSNTVDPLITKEGAVIQVANGGTSATAVTAALTRLAAYGFKVTAAPVSEPGANRSSMTTPTLRVRDRTAKPVTVNYLKNLLGATVTSDSSLPAGIDMIIDYVPAKSTAKATSSTTSGQSPPAGPSSAWSIQ